MIVSETRVAVCIVSHESEADIASCLEAVGRQSLAAAEVVVVDCASSDRSVEEATRAMPRGEQNRVVALDKNLGFAGGANRAIAETRSPAIVLLNPDAIPDPDYLRHLARWIDNDDDLKIGAVTGRLRRTRKHNGADRLDACGMYLSPTWRHFDRGSGEPDTGQYTTAERVFGATGAASMFLRKALHDIALDGEVFATEFHSFREDAELCFRLQERGWNVIYEPSASCSHRRRVTPERRRQLPAAVNFHSLKNRYLIRFYHQDLWNFLITLVPTVLRDLLALGWVLTLERSSLRAYGWIWKQRHVIRARRRQILSRRTTSSSSITRWFFVRSRPL